MEMAQNSSADRPQIAAGSLPVRRQVARRKVGLSSLDGRSTAYKRARQIAAELERGFGGEVTQLQRQAIERAALMTVIAEDLAARRLRGEAVSLDELLRAEGVARRAVRAVLAECPTKPAEPSPGLLLARERWAAAEEAKKAKAKDTEGTTGE
jgi:hypothetical protein